MKYLREKISKFANDKYGMLIFMSWIILIACLVVKMFGGNWFELSTENSKFIEFCLYVDEHMWLKAILACVIYVGTTYPILCIILNNKRLQNKHKILFIPFMILKSLISWYNVAISFVIDFIITLFIPILITKKIKRPLLCVVIVLIFQIMTIVIRNVSFDFNLSNTFIEQTLYQVDYYLMIILFYLYNFKERKEEED